MKTFTLYRHLRLAVGIVGLSCVAMPAFAQDAEKMHELQRIIAVQQKQLEIQQKQLDEQRQLLQGLQTQMESLTEEVETTEQGQVARIADHEQIVTSRGVDRVKLSISGWVNRAVNVVDDGKDTDAYFVDNDNSESRIDFRGTGEINDDLTLGSRIELTIAPDKAGNVNQNDKEAGDVFDQRITEMFVDSKRFGKVSLGKGHTASYGTASRDLSRTTVISYVTVADTAGGMLFRQKDDDTLTNLRIAEAFQSYDGLNRRSRVRYDTPTYHGFQFSTSLLTDQKYDAALWWGGQGYGFKAIGAAAVADPKQDDADLQYDGSFSLLHQDTGLNLTLSAGLLEHDKQSSGKNYYGKIGWLTRFFSFGDTAFSVDYGETKNQPRENDDGYTAGFAAVQSFEKFGSELYFLYRKYSLDRDVEPNIYDIDVVSIGTRVKF